MMELNGKVAVITGATRGLGLAIAQAMAHAGAAVVVSSRSAAAVKKAVEQIRAAGGVAAGLACDVGDLAQVQRLAEHALQQFGRIDIWVNNAGVAGPYGPTLGLAAETFHQVAQTNILGVYHGSITAMAHFLSRKQGKLINVLGHGYNNPVPYQSAYGSSKAWVRSFTLALASEYKDSGVGIFAFNPGMVLTDLLTHVEVIDGYQEKLKVFPTIIRMWAQPAEIPARKAVWAASAATDGKTGRLINTHTFGRVAWGALREGLRLLFKRPEPPQDLVITPIAPADNGGKK